MTTAIRFTLPAGLQSRDLPAGCAPSPSRATGTIRAAHREPTRPPPDARHLGARAGFDLPDLDVHRPTLEDVYLSLTGSPARRTTNEPDGAAPVRLDLRALLRNRQSQFFTLALPVLFLVIFASIFGGAGHTVPVSGGRINTSVYYVPGIITLGIIAAAFVNLVISVTAQRETGVLKRRRATPGTGERHHRRPGAHRRRHRLHHRRRAARHRLGRLRRPRPRTHRAALVVTVIDRGRRSAASATPSPR